MDESLQAMEGTTSTVEGGTRAQILASVTELLDTLTGTAYAADITLYSVEREER